MLTDVPKAQGNQKAIIKLMHVCDSFQIPVNQNETVVLPQESGSLKHSALYHRSCHLLISRIIFGAKFFMLVRCIFMTSPSESYALLFLQPPSIWKVEEKPVSVYSETLPTPDPLPNHCNSLNSPEQYYPFIYIPHLQMMVQAPEKIVAERKKKESFKKPQDLKF